MALFYQTNNPDPIELFKWFQERKANAALPKSQQSNALGSKPGDVGTGELSPVEDYFASMWEKAQQSIEAARKELAPTMEQKAQQSAEEAAALRAKRGLTNPVASLGSVITRNIEKDKMQASINSAVLGIDTEEDKPEKKSSSLSFGSGLMARPEEEPVELSMGEPDVDKPIVGEATLGLGSLDVYAPKGKAYRSSKVAKHSYYSTPIEDKGVRGNSRVYGDASKAVQQASIDAIISAGKEAGMSKDEIALSLAIARHESGFNPDAAAGTTSAQGLGQFIDRTGESYGINDDNRWDINAQAKALVEHTKDNIALAKKRNKGIEYAYKYHHDGPSKDYGGLDIAKEKVMPLVSTFKSYLDTLEE